MSGSREKRTSSRSRRNRLRHRSVSFLVRKSCSSILGSTSFAIILVAALPLLPVPSFCQQQLTWEQVRNEFEAVNPTLKAAQINIAESRANEITANLRPNPSLNLLADGTQLAPNNGVWQPITGTYYSAGVSRIFGMRRGCSQSRPACVRREIGAA